MGSSLKRGQLPWSGAWEAVHITVKELLLVVVACALWSRVAKGGRIQCRIDNAAVVSIINSGLNTDELAMHIVRCLTFFAAYFEYRIRAIHIPSTENGALVALSRYRLAQFRSQVQLVRGSTITLTEGAAGHASAQTHILDIAALEQSVQRYFT